MGSFFKVVAGDFFAIPPNYLVLAVNQEHAYNSLRWGFFANKESEHFPSIVCQVAKAVRDMLGSYPELRDDDTYPKWANYLEKSFSTQLNDL